MFFLLPLLKNATCYYALPIRVINEKLFPHPVTVALRCLQYFCSESKWPLLHSVAVCEPPRLIVFDAAAGACHSRKVVQRRRNRSLSAHRLLILNATLDLSMSSMSTGCDRHFPGERILSDSSLLAHLYHMLLLSIVLCRRFILTLRQHIRDLSERNHSVTSSYYDWNSSEFRPKYCSLFFNRVCFNINH